MDKDKLNRILEYLEVGSKRKLLAWKAGVNDEFQLEFGATSVVVGWKSRSDGSPMLKSLQTMMEVQGPSGAYLNIFNADGLRILSLNNLNIEQYGKSYETLKGIYFSAKNLVYRYDETFDEILSGIDQVSDATDAN